MSHFLLGGENVKRILALILSCLMLTGCQGITFSVEDLLTSPVIADEQTAIFQALTEGLGKSITLEYPYSGEYRSAIILENIDGSEDQEALAFYSETLNESVAGVAVLDKDENGDWKLSCTVDGVGNAIDKVIIQPLNNKVDVIIGYRVNAFDENQVRMYRYTDGYLVSIYENSYTALDRYDLDGDQRDEIVIAKKSGDYANVSIINSPDGSNYLSYELTIAYSASGISSYSFGRIDETTSALYLDLLNEGGVVSTEIVYLENDSIVCPTNDINGLREFTRRPSGYLSLDYDNDGTVEIPLVSSFTGYNLGSGTTNEFMTMWYKFDPQAQLFALEANSYYSIAGSFVLTIPNRWLGLVTLKADPVTGEVTFYKYDPNVQSIDEMSPIMSVVSAYEQNAEDYTEDDGYKLVAQTDRRQYFVKTMSPEGEPLVLTNDEILDNLFCLE